MSKLSPYSGLKYTWVADDGCKYRLHRETKTPQIKIEIHTYMGVCPGAMHYYGTIKGDRPSVYNIDQDQVFFLGGWGEDAPNFYRFQFEAKRVLNRVEKDDSGRLIGNVGYETNRFNDVESALVASIKTTQDNFRDTKTSHWLVKFDDDPDYMMTYRLHELGEVDVPKLAAKLYDAF